MKKRAATHPKIIQGPRPAVYGALFCAHFVVGMLVGCGGSDTDSNGNPPGAGAGAGSGATFGGSSSAGGVGSGSSGASASGGGNLPLPNLPAAQCGSSDEYLDASSRIGGPGTDDIIAGAAVMNNGNVVIGGVLSSETFGGVTPTLLGGATAASRGTLLVLSPCGREVLAAARVPGIVRDLDVDANNNVLVAAHDAGLLQIDGALTQVRWQKQAAKTTDRVDVAPSGTAVTLHGVPKDQPFAGGGLITVYGQDGAELGSFGSYRNAYDVATDGTAVYSVGFHNGHSGKNPVHVAYVRKDDFSGNKAWVAYDWNPGLLENAGFDNSMADTRGTRVHVGEDGALYALFIIAGGNHIFRYHSLKPYEEQVKVTERIVEIDRYNQMWNTQSQHKAFYGRYDIGTGDMLVGQAMGSVLTDEQPTKVNSLNPDYGDIAADKQGRVYFTAPSAAGTHKVNKSGPGLPFTFDPVPHAPPEYGGGPALVVLSHDFKQRVFVGRLSGNGTPRAVAVRSFADGEHPSVVWGGQWEAKDPSGLVFYEKAPLQPGASAIAEGFFAVRLGRK